MRLPGPRGSREAAIRPADRDIPSERITLARVDEYDPRTGTWTRQHDMITARRAFASGVDGKILVSGDMSFTDPNNVTYIDSIEANDPATDTWTELSATRAQVLATSRTAVPYARYSCICR